MYQHSFFIRFWPLGGSPHRYWRSSGRAATRTWEERARPPGGPKQWADEPTFNGGTTTVMDYFVGYGDRTDVNGQIDEPGSVTTTSVGGFANARVYGDLIVGAGYDDTKQNDIHYDANGNRSEFGWAPASQEGDGSYG